MDVLETTRKRLAFCLNQHRKGVTGYLPDIEYYQAVLERLDPPMDLTLNQKTLKVESWAPDEGGSWARAMRVPRGVKITHLPTGIVVMCASERSQYRNRDLALKQLQERLSTHVPRKPS